MDLGDSPEEAAFRAEVHAWLSQNATPRGLTRAVSTGSSDHSAAIEERLRDARVWQRKLYDAGWAGITLPTQYGGRGCTTIQQIVFAEELAKFDVTSGALSIGLELVAPTLIAHGSDEQKEAHLGPILRGEEVWCQLFSEPGAGSDLASLGTRAVRDGDDYVITGQKVWNSFARIADYGILLARTDPDAPKNKGITYFIVDMSTPGVEVRPLRQITGVAHFNEVFLTDVRVPLVNAVGQIDDGWRVTTTTLGSERAMIGGSAGAGVVDELIDVARRMGRLGDPVIRQGIAKAYERANTLSYLGYRLKTALSKGKLPGPEASVLKLAYSKHMVATGDLAMEILGADGMLWGADAPDGARWQDYLLSQYTVRLGGGTDEVQRNVIAERSLGLPREQSADRNKPWRELVKP